MSSVLKFLNLLWQLFSQKEKSKIPTMTIIAQKIIFLRVTDVKPQAGVQFIKINQNCFLLNRLIKGGH